MKITDEAVEALSESLIGPAWATFDEGLLNTLRAIHRSALEAALPHLGGATTHLPNRHGESVTVDLDEVEPEGATPVADRKRVEQVLRDRLVASNFNDNLHEPLRTQSIDTWVEVLAGSLFFAGLFREGATPAIDREALTAAVMAKAQAVELDGGYIAVLIAPEDAVTAILPLIGGAS